VISVDTKKKEAIRSLQQRRQRLSALRLSRRDQRDFVNKELRNAIPQFTTSARTPVASASASITTPLGSPSTPFAAGAIRMGGERYPRADRLMITADGGGSNGSRVRLWYSKSGSPDTALKRISKTPFSA